jgi:DNA-binding transcriptional MerR regulator
LKPGAARMYQAREFAKLAGLTVRTLHHYDQLGLLKPSGRTQAGYRLYSDRDLVKLEQIVVLKFLGLPLKQIAVLLAGQEPRLPEILRRQREILEERRAHLEKAIQAIGEAEHVLAFARQPEWDVLPSLIKVIRMNNDTNWAAKYYSDEAQAKIEERKKLWSPELQERVTREWQELGRDIEAALGEAPASPVAQALADRWCKLLEGFTGGDPDIQAGLNRMYADRENWPVRYEMPYSKEAEEFILRALAARRTA